MYPYIVINIVRRIIMTKTDNRNLSYDILRIFASLCVVYIHQSSYVGLIAELGCKRWWFANIRYSFLPCAPAKLYQGSGIND